MTIERNNLALRMTYQGDEAFVELFGELDIASSPVVVEALGEIESRGAGHVVIDLSGLEFVDSSGIQTLLRATQAGCNGAPEILLLRAPRQVQRLFELIGLQDTLRFVD